MEWSHGTTAVRLDGRAEHQPAGAAGDSIGGRLAAGDVTAVADAYTALAPLTASYLRRLLPEDDIDDVLQRVFVEVWRCQSRYDPARSLEGWVLGIARKRAIDQLRASRFTPLPVSELPEAAGGPDVAEQVTAGLQLRAGLDGLPAEQREALELAYFGGLTQPEIARCLNVPIGTVKARMARGMRRLAATIGADR